MNTSLEATLSGSVIQITANRASITLTGTTSNYRDNLMIAWTMGSVPNPGPVRLNIDGVGPISLRDNRGASLSSSVLPAGARALAVKDAANDYFRLLWPHPDTGAAGILTTAGDLLYEDANGLQRLAIGTAGQVLQTNSTPDAPEWAERIVSGTPQSGTGADTFFDFTVPTWARRITISFAQFSTSGTSDPIIQIGDAGGIETTGYLSVATNTGTDTAADTSTGGFLLMQAQVAAAVWHGSVTLTLIDSATNLWASSGVLGRTDSALTAASGGSKALSGALTTVRVIATNGTDTIDGGTVNVQYE